MSCPERWDRFGDTFTFGQIERGIEDCEFCPNNFTYFLMLRNSTQRMAKYIGAPYAQKISKLKKLMADGAPLHKGFGDHHAPFVVKNTCPEPSLKLTGREPSSQSMQMDNMAVRALAVHSKTLHSPFGSIGQEAFDRAVNTLCCFDLVETLPPSRPLDEFQAEAHRVMGWNLTEGQIKKKVNSHGGKSQKPNATEWRQLEELNKWDVKLFKMIAVQHFPTKCSEEQKARCKTLC